MLLLRIREAKENDNAVRDGAREYLYKNERSELRDQLLAMITAHTEKDEQGFYRHANLLADNFPGLATGQYANLAMAEAAFIDGKYSTCERLCRKILNDARDDLAPQAMIMLSRVGIAKDNSERALLNYNILRERYPYAVGQDLLIDLLRDVSDEQSEREAKEVHAGIVYYVQVGVFGEEDNAEAMAERVQAYGYKAYIRDKTISSRRYNVVLAGKFSSMEEAESAKTRLEIGENDIFKVVVEDER
jgi:hypothetical protein